MQQGHHLFVIRTFLNRHQPVFRRHDSRNGRVQFCLKSQVAMRDDTYRLSAVHDRHARNPHRASQFDNLTNGHIRPDSNRLAYHAGFEFLDHQDLSRLLFDGHVLVNNPHAAFLGERYRKSRLGNRIHRC